MFSRNIYGHYMQKVNLNASCSPLKNIKTQEISYNESLNDFNLFVHKFKGIKH